MFASGTGSMRGPRMKTPLLLLLLLTTLTRTVICQNEYDGEDPEAETPEEEAVVAEDGNVDTELPDPDSIDATSAPDESNTEENQNFIEEGHGSGVTSPVYENEGDISETGITDTTASPDEPLSAIIILIPVVLVVVIIGMIVCGIFINRRWNQKARNQELRKEDPYLDGSSTEKVPMPMFEEDVPSVLELEMEDFDQWMKKDVEPAEDSIHA